MSLNDLWFDPTLCFIANEWVSPANGQFLDIHDPSTGNRICSIARGSEADINSAVSQAEASLEGEWGRMSAAERGRILYRMGQLVLEKTDALARLEAMDVGTTFSAALA